MKYLEKNILRLARLYESKYVNKTVIDNLIKTIDKGVGDLDYETNVRTRSQSQRKQRQICAV